jgi:hypothetical protein
MLKAELSAFSAKGLQRARSSQPDVLAGLTTALTYDETCGFIAFPSGDAAGIFGLRPLHDNALEHRVSVRLIELELSEGLVRCLAHNKMLSSR